MDAGRIVQLDTDRVAMQWCKELNTFFVNGRHYCVSVFITSQHVKGIGPSELLPYHHSER